MADVTSTWGAEGDIVLSPFEIAFSRPIGIPINDQKLPNLSESWASFAQLDYDVTTGDLVVDTTGYISSIILTAGEDTEFDTPNIPWADQRFVTETSSHSFAIGGLMEPGLYSIEALLPPGLDQAELLDAISVASFHGAAGVGGTPFDFETDSIAMSIVHVPEPSAFLMCWIPVFIAHALRRRRSSFGD